MSNILNVTLDTSVTPNRLSVDDKSGQNQVSQSPNAQTITWQLTGNLTQGDFVPMTDSNPGFSWFGTTPSAQTFGTPTIGANGNSLSISVTHPDANSNGSWIYVLRVSLNNVVYTTTASLPSGTTNNPTIINK